MLRISYWAHGHLWPARIIIIGLYVLINFCGWYIGSALFEIGFQIPFIFFNALLLLCLVLLGAYPAKRNKNAAAKSRYTYRKAFDLLLITTSFLLVVSTANNNYWGNNTSVNALYSPEKNAEPNILPFQQTIKDFKKQSRKIAKATHPKKAKKLDLKKVLLILLALLVAFAALYGLAFLSCSIACSGAEAIAVIVAIGGTALVIFLLVKVIKRIHNKPGLKKKMQEEVG